jgi:MFS transporter, ACS family, tartrate transporter
MDTVTDAFSRSRQLLLLRKLIWRLMPFLFISYVVSYVDRLNVSIAALTMSHDLAMTPRVLGLGFGIFSVGYVSCEIPSNLMLHRFGARRWIARIMISWGIVSAGTALVSGATGFFAARFLLGVAEAGFVPGICYYLTLWFPNEWRGKAMVAFLIAVPVSGVIGSPLSGALLGLEGTWGLHGWQWLFIIEGLPAVICGIVCLWVLTDRPETAGWLTEAERTWLTGTLSQERSRLAERHSYSIRQVLTNGRVITLALINFCYIVGTYGISAWMPQAVKGFGLSNFAVGVVVAIPYAFASVAMILWARHSDATLERTWHVAGAGILTAIGLAVSGNMSSPLLAMIALTIGLMGNYAFFATFWTIPPSFLAGQAAAAGFALIISVGNLGGLVGPYVLGWSVEVTHSFTLGFTLMAGFFLVASLGVLLLHYVARPVTEDLRGRRA